MFKKVTSMAILGLFVSSPLFAEAFCPLRFSVSSELPKDMWVSFKVWRENQMVYSIDVRSNCSTPFDEKFPCEKGDYVVTASAYTQNLKFSQKQGPCKSRTMSLVPGTPVSMVFPIDFQCLSQS